MAKSLRSKVKKRLRTVKRGVVKRELTTKGTSHNDRELAKTSKLNEALSGHVKTTSGKKPNAFRSDDPDAEIPQHNWRQGPDFRSGFAGPEAGYAVTGTNRPKFMNGRDAPGASIPPPAAVIGQSDRGLDRLMRTTEQTVPFMSNKNTKRRLKNKSGVNVNAAFKWT